MKNNSSILIRAKRSGAVALFLFMAMAMLNQSFALTNSFTTIQGMWADAQDGFDWGMTTALGVVGLAIIVGWLKYGVKATFGGKKTG